jgi:hypothetical protein
MIEQSKWWGIDGGRWGTVCEGVRIARTNRSSQYAGRQRGGRDDDDDGYGSSPRGPRVLQNIHNINIYSTESLEYAGLSGESLGRESPGKMKKQRTALIWGYSSSQI